MLRVYCSLSDVKRLLRSVSNRESKIRFSEAYRNLQADNSNNGTIALSGVIFNDSFADHENYTFTFTDSTSFDVIGDLVGNIGSGNKLDSFEAEERFIVPSANWSGEALPGDKYYITSASDVSNDDGHAFIVDSTKRINARLEKIYGVLDSCAFYDSTSEEIPDAINFACVRYTAYDIFNSVFAGVSPDDISPVRRWKIAAEDTLDEFLTGHGKGPIWKSRPVMVTELGTAGVSTGIVDLGNLTDSQSKKYTR